MTTAVLQRTSSVSLQKLYPDRARGNNTDTLPFEISHDDKAIRILLYFPIPAEVLLPTTQITSATLTARNAVSGPTPCTLTAYRILGDWSGRTATWNNRPTYASAVGTDVTKATSAVNALWSWDVLAQVRAIQAAGKNQGLTILDTAGSESVGRLANTADNMPTLTIVYSTGPALPTRLSPATGQVVSAPKPVLRITSAQLGEPVHEMNVQIDDTMNGVTPDFESGWVDATTSEIDTADYAGAPTLSSGGSTSWRVKVRDIDGTETKWSAWQTFTYRPLGSLTITSPPVSPDNTTTRPSPPVVWDFTGQTQTAYRVIYTALADPQEPLYDTGRITSVAETVTPAGGICGQTDEPYSVQVEVWDQYNRVANGGEVEHVTATRDFSYILSADVDPLDTFTVDDLDPLPFAKLVGTRAVHPDSFQIIRDGKSIGVFDADDLLVSGDTFEFVDYLASPRRQHTWYMRCIVDGETSAANSPATKTITPAGLWLSQPDKDRYLPFITDDAQAVGLSEDGGTFNPLNAAYAVRITSSLRGWSGTVVGEILATHLTDSDLTGSGLRDLFLAMRADTGAPMILTLLDVNLKVVAFNMTIAPTPTTGKNEDYVFLASLEFIEVQ